MLFAALPWIAMADQAPAGAGTPAAETADKPQENNFDILEYAVEGNSVLSTLQIEEAVYPHLGEKKSIKDVELARQALEKPITMRATSPCSSIFRNRK